MQWAILLAAALVGYNAVTNLWWSLGRWYVPAHLALAAVLMGGAVAAGLYAGALGLAPGAALEGLRWGGGATIAVAVVLAVAGAAGPNAPLVGALLRDRRVAVMDDRRVAYEAFVRIPLGTALLEEVAFRGVLLAAFADAAGTTTGVVASSAAFGLWHIGPTIPTVRANEHQATRGRVAWLVLAGVVVTTVGGALFAWLRLASGSLLAPVLAHWATNALALLTAAVVQGSRTGERTGRGGRA